MIGMRFPPMTRTSPRMRLADKGDEAMAERFFRAFHVAGLDDRLAAAAR